MIPAWLLALGLASADTVATPRVTPDRWLAPDKVKHLVVAAAAQSGTYATLRLGADHGAALAGATVATVALSVVKERLDRRGTGFSVRDLAWDAAGIAIATFVLTRAPHR